MLKTSYFFLLKKNEQIENIKYNCETFGSRTHIHQGHGARNAAGQAVQKGAGATTPMADLEPDRPVCTGFYRSFLKFF